MNNILVAGCTNSRGFKLTKFLLNRGFSVFGVDRFHNDEVEQVVRYFRIDLRHPQSMELVMEVAKPTTVVFCPDINVSRDSFTNIDYSYIAYLNLLMNCVKFNVENIILCIDEVKENPETPAELTQLSLSLMTNIFSKKAGLQNLIITRESNLLKEIKRFLLSNDEEEVTTNE